jgi:hypothetical protein
MAESLTQYWLDHYVHRDHCSLCGNSGVVDTTGVRTPTGHECGRRNWCICPNGQAMREASGAETPPLPRLCCLACGRPVSEGCDCPKGTPVAYVPMV